jgi:hypothetical protein
MIGTVGSSTSTMHENRIFCTHANLLIVLINFTAGVSEVWQVLDAKDPEQGEIHVTGLIRQVQLARGQAGAG